MIRYDRHGTWVACLFFFFVSLSSGTAWAQKTLTILHTNDTHSCIMPLNKNLADTMLADRGGYLRRIEMLKQERQKDPLCCCSTVVTSRKAAVTTPCSRVMWKWGL